MANFIIKSLQSDYKKCKEVKGRAEAAEAIASRMKFFRYDLSQSLEVLEELVLEEKMNEEPIAAKKIEDYKQNRGIAPVLKAVKWNYDKWTDATKDFEKLKKDAGLNSANEKKLQKLKDVFVKLKKSGKLEKELAVLDKKIDDDLQEIKGANKAIKDVPTIHLNPDKEYSQRIKYIMTAKPRLSNKQKKYNDLAPELTKKAMEKVRKECAGYLKELKAKCELALKNSEKNNTKKAVANWQDGTKEFQKLENVVKKYAGIQKKYKNEIPKGESKKIFPDYMGRLEKLEEVATTLREKTLASINELQDKAKEA